MASVAESPVIELTDLGKSYKIWADPRLRLMGMLAGGICEGPWAPNSLRDAFRRRQSAHYRECHALAPMSLTVHKGEAIGIVGRNGSGKSTLLQLLAGTLQPSSGSVRVNGRLAALLELGSGFNPEFTGRENVFLNAAILGLSRAEAQARFAGIERFAGIGDYIDQPVKTYSSGMVVRLAFAVQTAVDPQILIIDEALSVGDEVFQRKCFARLERLREQGVTILFVSHDASSVVNLCTRALWLHKGKLLLEGAPKQVVSCYQKFCHAPEEQAEGLIEKILAESVQITNGDSANRTPSPQTQSPTESEIAAASAFVGEALDPHLQPASTYTYESYGAEIIDPHIETLDGQRVNQLVQRREYVFCYEVRFSAPCHDVAFAMLIRTPKGMELGGSVTRYRDLPEVEPDKTYKVRFRFRCQLVPWLYFLNAGVECRLGNKRAYAHRILDAAAFRVVADPSLPIITALVDFGFSPQAEPVPLPDADG